MVFAPDCLQGKAILITGGLGAIGKVVVQKLLAHCKRSVWAVWTGLILVGILPSGHSGCVHLEGRWTLGIPQ